MPETRSLESKPDVRSPSNSPQVERFPTSAGDDWLCLSWLDRSDQPLPPARPADGECQTIDGYELLREAGRGELSIVYFARDRTFKRRVAIKFFRGSTAADRLRHEVEATSGLKITGWV